MIAAKAYNWQLELLNTTNILTEKTVSPMGSKDILTTNLLAVGHFLSQDL
jgi:hypothetical protein